MSSRKRKHGVTNEAASSPTALLAALVCETGDQEQARDLLREALLLTHNDRRQLPGTSSQHSVTEPAKAAGPSDELLQQKCAQKHESELERLAQKQASAAMLALQTAQTEGLVLERIDSKSGYKGVHDESRPGTTLRKPYQAKFRRQSLGMFATVEEAALAYARAVKAGGPSHTPQQHQDVHRLLKEASGAVLALHTARAEGLVLERIDSKTGYRGVFEQHMKGSALRKPLRKPYRAEFKKQHLGYFATVEEAALAYARAVKAV